MSQHSSSINRVTVVTFLLVQVVSQKALAESAEWVYDRASRSVVTIHASDFESNSSRIVLGSGVVIAENRIVTNCHVVTGARRVTVSQFEKTYKANGVFRHDFADICLLSVPHLPLPPIESVRTIRELRIGQRVYAIGSPSGLESTLSDGLISGLRRMPKDRTQSLKDMQDIVQTSAAIEHGSSGGGLFDETGALVGITSFGKSSGNQNFAIPVDRVTEILKNSVIAQYSSLSASVQANLKPSIADEAAPSMQFFNGETGKKWLAELNERYRTKIPEKDERIAFLTTVNYEAIRAGLDPQLVLAMIDVLSGTQKYVVGKNGAQGYMQVRPAWVAQIGEPNQNLFSLRTNLRYGCTILRFYLDDETGNLYRALWRYNVDRLQGTKIPESDSSFQDAVLRTWREVYNLRKN